MGVFQEGNKVTLRGDSEHYGEPYSLVDVGTIIRIDSIDSIYVTWQEGDVRCESVYTTGDLALVSDTPSTQPVKSTGGKSSYYKIVLPQWLLDKQAESGYIMIEDLAEVMYDNDFNFTNVMKAQKRMYELQNGGGKAGNDFQYDATKVKYYTAKQVEVYNRNK